MNLLVDYPMSSGDLQSFSKKEDMVYSVGQVGGYVTVIHIHGNGNGFIVFVACKKDFSDLLFKPSSYHVYIAGRMQKYMVFYLLFA